MHALIIEDQLAIASQVEEMLRELGYTSFHFADREGIAVAMAEERCPDLITADHRLTDGSGIKAVQTICEKRAIPVIIIAADTGLEVDVGSVPDAVLLPKPFRETDFRQAVGDAAVKVRRKMGAG